MNLVGVKEAAVLLDITQSQFWNVRHRRDFPAPVASLAAGDVWNKKDVLRYKRSLERKHLPVIAA